MKLLKGIGYLAILPISIAACIVGLALITIGFAIAVEIIKWGVIVIIGLGLVYTVLWCIWRGVASVIGRGSNK